MVKAIVGANWGDEGKGKITDMLAEESDIIVRFQGGANAGHTIINDYGKFALHLLPSGVFYNHTTSVIGNGVALNIPYLVKELKSLTDRNVPMPKILVSDRAQILMPYHVAFDTYEEARLAGKSFGSTKSGIAPFYSDKYAKIGFQVNELFGDEQELKEKIANVCTLKNVMLEHLYHQPLLNEEEIFNTLMEYKEMVEPYVCDTSAFLHQALKDGKKILLEGQLGSLKDTDHGIYPMVTSSSTLAPYGAIGAGIPALQVHQFMLNLQEMEDLQILWRQVQLLRLHSADHVLVQEIHLLIMHSQSDIQQETSLTEKVLNYRMDRYHLLLLWMHVLLQQQQLIRDTLQQQQTWM